MRPTNTLHVRALPGLLLLTLMVLATACATTGLEPPEVTLVNLEMTNMTLFETTLTTRVRIANVNPEPLVIEGASFKLVLDGRKVGTGLSDDEVTVERLASELVTVTFHVNNASLLLRLRELFEDEEVEYGIRGTVYVQGQFGTRRLKVEQTGRLDLGGGDLFTGVETEI